jgi:hypothetical protein
MSVNRFYLLTHLKKNEARKIRKKGGRKEGRQERKKALANFVDLY